MSPAQRQRMTRNKRSPPTRIAADLQVKLAQIALDAQRAASQQDIAEDALALDSTKNARTTLKALAEINNPIENTPAYVSYIVIAGFFVTVLLLFSPLPNWLGTKDPILQIINICIGAITAAFTTVVQFWLGSSSGIQGKGQYTRSVGSCVQSFGRNGATRPSQPPASQPPVLQPVSLTTGKSHNRQASQPAISQPASPQATTAGPDRFPACIPLTLAWEGGNDDDPNDPGGRTSRGIIQREWDVWRQTHAGLPSDVWQAPQERSSRFTGRNTGTH